MSNYFVSQCICTLNKMYFSLIVFFLSLFLQFYLVPYLNDFTDLRIRKQNICVLVGVSLPARYTAFSQLRLAVGTIANNNRGD